MIRDFIYYESLIFYARRAVAEQDIFWRGPRGARPLHNLGSVCRVPGQSLAQRRRRESADEPFKRKSNRGEKICFREHRSAEPQYRDGQYEPKHCSVSTAVRGLRGPVARADVAERKAHCVRHLTEPA